MRKVLLSSPLYTWGNEGIARLPKVTLLRRVRTGIEHRKLNIYIYIYIYVYIISKEMIN